MKNRKKIATQEKPVVSESNVEKLSEKKKKKAQIQQTFEFLQEYSKVFNKPRNLDADVDTYFKQTLRSCGPIELNSLSSLVSNSRISQTKSLKSLSNRAPPTPKPTKSYTLLLKAKKKQDERQQRNKKSRFTYLKKDLQTVVDLRDIKQPVEAAAAVGATDDFDVFYSPSSHTIKSSETSLHSFSEESSPGREFPNNNYQYQLTMAEEEDGFEQTSDIPETTTPGETTTETEDDEMKEVDSIIKRAAQELDQVAEENQDLFGDMGEEEGGEKAGGPMKKGEEAGGGSFFEFDPAIDAAVLRELEEAEKQAKETAKVINELKIRVTQLLKKEKHTEQEAKELEQKNQELKAAMLLFEEKTKRIQFLIAQSNLFENMIPPKTPLQVKHHEDALPKVIVCGMTEENMPKLIVCDDNKHRKKYCPGKPPGEKCKPAYESKPSMACVPKIAQRLNESYCMQERLATENADLEGNRYKLQTDLLMKDQTIEYLQRQLCSLQTEMRMMCKENCALNDKIQQVVISAQSQAVSQPGGDMAGIKCGKRKPCGKGKGPCPADIEGRLVEYQETTKALEKQLVDMESDVKAMQTELQTVQNERDHLEQHRKVIICPMPPCHPPCSPCSPCSPCPPCLPCMPSCDQQLRESKEKYDQLQDDFKGKVVEVAGLRTDNERFKQLAKDAEDAKKTAEEKVRELERILKEYNNKLGKNAGSKEALLEMEQQLAVAKQRFREAQDELEELRAFITDQQSQLDDYRNKYLEAQQMVEEQRRQIDILELDANRINDQVNLEIQRVKNQFQEKLQELMPLPDLLKATQLKLQEAQQMHLLAERNNEALARDLMLYKDQVAAISEELEILKGNAQLGAGEKDGLMRELEELRAKVEELEEENFHLKQDLENMTQLADEAERRVQEKLHEIAQLTAQLDTVREESARQVARNKERCETVRRSMQNQISDLERQLAQSRAQAKAAQKDRDEIRQKMQAQINNLHENFEDAQMRIRNLQGHVNFLKDSYNTVCPPPGDGDNVFDHQDPCCCGVEY